MHTVDGVLGGPRTCMHAGRLFFLPGDCTLAFLAGRTSTVTGTPALGASLMGECVLPSAVPWWLHTGPSSTVVASMGTASGYTPCARPAQVAGW